jgi:hypothetical protein
VLVSPADAMQQQACDAHALAAGAAAGEAAGSAAAAAPGACAWVHEPAACSSGSGAPAADKATAVVVPAAELS